MRDQVRWQVLACKYKIQVRCTQFESGEEIFPGVCGIGVVDEEGVVVERVHGDEHETE
jgi:hypothetical protein